MSLGDCERQGAPVEENGAEMTMAIERRSEVIMEAVARDEVGCSERESSPVKRDGSQGHVSENRGGASPLFKAHVPSEETNGTTCEKTCSASGALRVPQEVSEPQCKLDNSPEVKGPRREQVEGAAPGSVPATRVSSSRKGKELPSQAGRVLRDGAVGEKNPSPRSVRSSHRRVPLGWFPRGQKTESYLERKIRMLQTEGGKIASLDETLGAIHLSRIEREKQAAQAAAAAATETRKVALVEASWCRILKATGIPFMAAALELQRAEKAAEEALAAATALGVVLGHSPRSPRFVTETDGSSGGHDNVSATLETAFDVDKAVAAALRTALLRHTSELKDAELQRAMALITNPQVNVSTSQREWVDGISKPALEGSDSDSGGVSKESENSMVVAPKPAVEGSGQANPLVESMLQRVRGLKPEECTSMATIVAARGLGALLQEENLEHELDAKPEGGGGLGDVLVKHVSRLEAAKAAAKTAGQGGRAEMKKRLTVVLNPVPDLGSMFVKHVSRLEREKKAAIEAAAKEAESWIPGEAAEFVDPASEEGGLDKIFVKKMSRLEKEKAAAQQRRRSSLNKFSPRKGSRRVSLTRRPGLGESLIKHKSRLEKEIEAAKARRLSTTGKSMKKVAIPPPSPSSRPSLGTVLVKHKSRLEREKEAAKLASQAVTTPSGPKPNADAQEVKPNSDVAVAQPGLADLGARKLSKLEMEKQAAASNTDNGNPWARRRSSLKSRNDSSEIWAGIGLGAALKRHVSNLEQEQAAWRNAEEMARAH